MGKSIQVSNIETWRAQLGLLPVPLFDSNLSQQGKYVLLNGHFGNFCLDININNNINEQASRNYAWSSDVGHYVNILGNSVEVYRWDKKPSFLERYKKESIEQNLDKFYAYLQKNQPRREHSIISFTIDIFRRLRGALIVKGVDDGQEALNAFLFFLACSSEGAKRDHLDLDKWQLDPKSKSIAAEIRPLDWEDLIGELKEGVLDYNLQPDISLLLRHASGQLFQEAHYIAHVKSPQLTFDGLPPIIIPDKKRKRRDERDNSGVYYTPTSIVRTLVEESLVTIGTPLPHSLTVFDPACGSGEFLKEILRQLTIQNYHGKIILIGWDILPTAVNITKFVLAREMAASNLKATMQIDVRDSLTSKDWPKDVDLILMNPPFCSWEDMKEAQQEIAKSTLGSLLEKRPDQASLFFYKAVQSIKKEGVLGSILPASILNADSYRKFRGEIATAMSARLIGKLGSQSLFANAIVDAAIYVGKLSARREMPATALWADHRLESASAALRSLRRQRATDPRAPKVNDEPGFSIYPNPRIGISSDSWSARPYKSYKLFNTLESFSRVKDFFTIMQGARTGYKPAFVITKDELNSLSPRERQFFRPAVVNESIRNGVLNDSAYVFYPYGKNIIDTEEDLKKQVTTYCAEHLLPNKSTLEKRKGVNEHRWWELTRHRDKQIEIRPKLVSTYFGKAGSFAWDDSGDFVVVQGHDWIPKTIIEKKYKIEKKFNQETGLAYLALLCSPLINLLLSYVSNHLGGGQWDLSQKCIHNMPIPNLFSEEVNIELFENLVEIGRLISQGDKYDIGLLTELTLCLYNLPPDEIELFNE